MLVSCADDEGWRPRAARDVATAAAMIVLLSPDSVVLERCVWEAEEAQRLGLPLFPVICRSLPADDAAEKFFRPRVYVYPDTKEGLKGHRWGQEFQALRRHLLETVEWERERARISALVEAWQGEGKPDGRLLEVMSLSNAESWVSRRPANAEPPHQSVLSFMAASRTRIDTANAQSLHRRLVQRGFIGPARAALEAGDSAPALRLMAAGAILSDDPSLVLDADDDEQHKHALWRAALSAVQGLPVAVFRHDKPVSAGVLSADGSRVLTASNRSARVWTANGSELALLPHGDLVEAVVFAAGGDLVVTSCQDHTLRVWDAASGSPVRVLRLTGNERGKAVFSRDGDLAITRCQDYTARVWDVMGTGEVAVLRGHGDDIEDVAFNSDGTQALTASREHVAVLWNAATGEDSVVYRGHEFPVTTVAFSPDGQRVLGGSWNATSRLWDAATGEELAVLIGPGTSHVAGVTFSPDGTRATTLFANRPGGIAVWELADASYWPAPDKPWTCATFSHDGEKLLTSSTEGTIQLWDVRTRSVMSVLAGHDGSVEELAFSQDDRRAFIRSDKTAYLTDLHCSTAVSTLTGHSSEVTSIAISSDGLRVVTGSDDGTARLWHTDSGELIAVLEAGSRVLSVAFNRDATQVLTASADGSLRVWDGLTGTATRHTPGAGDDVSCVAFSSDGSRRLAGFNDGTIVLFDNASGAEVLRIRAHDGGVTCLAFNVTGTAAVSGAFRCVTRVWDLASGQMIRELGRPTPSTELSVWSVAFCPTGTRAITCYAGRYVHKTIDMFSGDDVARVWDIATGQQVAVLRGHTRPVASVAFGPGGVCALTGSADGTVRLWDAATGAEMATLDAKGSYVVSNAMSADGTRAAAVWRHDGVRVWDTSRWTAFDGDRAVFLTAALDCGVGRRSEEERGDVLMSEAPDDLYAAMMDRLSPEQRARVPEVSSRLRSPLHPRCYASR